MTHAYGAFPVPGSRRRAPVGARRIGDADPHQPVEATVVLRRGEAGMAADPSDVERVRRFAQEGGLEVVAVHRPARSIRLSGAAAAMQAAFGVTLGAYEAAGVHYRGREGAVFVPEHLDGVVTAVLGLDNRPQARAHYRIAGVAGAPALSSGVESVVRARAEAAGMSPTAVARAYGFPDGATAAGQTVAFIELGGGYRRKDLRAYFAALGLPVPAIEWIGVDGATNAPGADADVEVALDIEVAGAVAPGAKLVVYFAPNTTDGFYDAIAAAVHDRTRRPSVISISWGQAESGWTESSLDAYDELFGDAATMGISVFAAAGDSGATDGVADGQPHVDFPGSSPSVVGCGGTKLTGAAETVWNETVTGDGATGGGYSAHFAAPVFQIEAGVPGGRGRGVPDVAGNADPLTGYHVRVGGRDLVIGGTSAVAPLWAALTALANARNGRPAGAPHERLYAAPRAFRDITEGDNGRYAARVGWDACTGLGTPHGDLVIEALAPVVTVA
jgi:kumamolisin